jgi:hypothetical protein
MAMGHKTTKHMDDSPFWELDNSSAGKDISHRLRNPKVYYCVPNSLNFVSNTFCALKLHGDSAKFGAWEIYRPPCGIHDQL